MIFDIVTTFLQSFSHYIQKQFGHFSLICFAKYDTRIFDKITVVDRIETRWGPWRLDYY